MYSGYGKSSPWLGRTIERGLRQAHLGLLADRLISIELGHVWQWYKCVVRVFIVKTPLKGVSTGVLGPFYWSLSGLAPGLLRLAPIALVSVTLVYYKDPVIGAISINHPRVPCLYMYMGAALYNQSIIFSATYLSSC